jgi:hypothetical protein
MCDKTWRGIEYTPVSWMGIMLSSPAAESKQYLYTFLGFRNVIDGRGYTVCCSMIALGIFFSLGSS